MSKVKSKLAAYWTTPLSSVKGERQSQSCYVFDFTFTKGKGVIKQKTYIFDFTFDAGQKCSKSSFLSFGFTRQYKVVINQPPPQALRFSHGRGERETSDW